ncbi:hypothetical protein [Thermaerobacillus caldiproteolyticus]|uniref:Uncharacterized protein n=1 Tax=Thermaerobacillus caldiproteolyticus TaxID=247480 RepID=A0A7W0BWR6_9BACL|nr:hypothetical protein [Anoxybacillus caldiproteolyticus]MBA2873756.1 hypothetical protein [Anoxybacillus caldiproteolyticus]QPA30318.1 hypothetical protein ISX45_11830 [Anoxybacillus caldiproteolyticus]
MKQVKEDVAVLKWDVASLKEGQSRQDKILERLLVRLIEQLIWWKCGDEIRLFAQIEVATLLLFAYNIKIAK